MNGQKANQLTGLSLNQLEAYVASLGEPRYRAAQLFSWLYKYGARSFGEMTNLPQELRTRLELSAMLENFSLAARQTSVTDRTEKFLFELSDGKKIETVLIPPRESAIDAEDRLSICISTQVGCPLDCKFCATASMGFSRNLTAGEIVNQFLTVQTLALKSITNIVFMGMGEPMLNYDNVMTAVDILTAQNGAGLSPRRITISTAGYPQQIRRLADEDRKIKLALSLHSLQTDVRTALMPITKKYPPDELLRALEYYFRKTKKSVMLEYILFEGLNDAETDVRRLVAASRRFQCRINLIPFHPIHVHRSIQTQHRLKGASMDSIGRFAKKLRDADIPVFTRFSAGVDIDAACGQLAVKNEAA